MSTKLGKTDAPAATRTRSAGWRDPRLWIGVALVAGSVLVGARVLGAAEDMTEVWALRADLAAGQSVAADDLISQRVRFADADRAERYLAVSEGVPDDAVLLRDVGADELLPADAVGSGEERVVEVPLSAPAENIPSTLTRGSRVDVYVVPERGPGADGTGQAQKVLDGVVVVAAPRSDDVLGSVGNRQILVAVPAEAEAEIGLVLAAARENRIQLTRQG